MHRQKFLWTNIILSSNIIFYIGFFICAVCFTIVYFQGNNNILNSLIWCLCIGFYFSYIILKTILYPVLTSNKYKKSFSYKLLKKFLNQKTFRKKILIHVLCADLLCFFLPLFFIFALGTKNHLTFINIFIFVTIIYFLIGTGSLLSYLSLLVWFKISNKKNKPDIV